MEQMNPLLIIFAVFYLLLLAIYIYAFWRIFVKAGKPGWAAIVPIYNIIILLEIVKKPVWWIVLFFIPLVNIVISLLISIELAKAFGKSSAYGIILLWLLAFVGYLMLAFDDSKYIGTVAQKTNTQTPTPPVQPGISSKPKEQNTAFAPTTPAQTSPKT